MDEDWKLFSEREARTEILREKELARSRSTSQKQMKNLL